MVHDVCLILLTKDTEIRPITDDALPSANRFKSTKISKFSVRITPCGSVHLEEVQTSYRQDAHNSVNFTLNNNNKNQMALFLNLLYQEKNFPDFHLSLECLIQAASVSWSPQGNIQNTQEPPSKPGKSRACFHSLQSCHWQQVTSPHPPPTPTPSTFHSTAFSNMSGQHWEGTQTTKDQNSNIFCPKLM